MYFFSFINIKKQVFDYIIFILWLKFILLYALVKKNNKRNKTIKIFFFEFECINF